MVTRELRYFSYIVKAYIGFFSVPLAIAAFIVLESALGMEEMVEGSIALLLFPFLILPVVAIMDIVGSLDQKELLLTYPVSPWLAGFVRPLMLGSLIALCFSSLVGFYLGSELVYSAFASALLVFSLTAFFIAFFKHAGLGLGAALFYLIFGLFTTGMGQGPLYAGQWYRPRPFTEVDEYAAVQLIAVAVLLFLTTVCLKYRHRFHLV